MKYGAEPLVLECGEQGCDLVRRQGPAFERRPGISWSSATVPGSTDDSAALAPGENLAQRLAVVGDGSLRLASGRFPGQPVLDVFRSELIQPNATERRDDHSFHAGHDA